jgi:nitroreductase
MEFERALRRRRMVRRHTGERIDPAVLERIAAAVARGPSAGNTQGVTAILVSERDRIATIATACGEASFLRRGFDPWLSAAAAHLVLCVEPARYRERYAEPGKDPAALETIPWWWVDGGAALMAVLLAAVDAGVGAGFLGGHRAAAVRPLLGVPEGVEILGIVTLGPAAPHPPSASARRPRRRDVVRRERW